MDRDWGSKPGSGGAVSAQNEAIDRREPRQGTLLHAQPPRKVNLSPSLFISMSFWASRFLGQGSFRVFLVCFFKFAQL